MRLQTFALQIALCTSALLAQPVVAPTALSVGPPRGEDWHGYNFVNSFETGYRFHSVGGDLDKYRSDINFGNGIRLLGANLRINSREGHGKYFDEIVLTAQGLGNDPYQYSSLRVQKNNLFRYDLSWRLNDYLNRSLTITSGNHLMNTQRRLQDHDLTLFPQSVVRFVFGYTRNAQDGPALSTVQQFGPLQDEFVLFSRVRRLRNEYRVGGEIRIFGATLLWLRGWDNFKEDSTYDLDQPTGNNAADLIALSRFGRVEPYHGNTPYWRFALLKEASGWLGVNMRYAYSEGRRNFVLDELASGMAFGAERNRAILVFGTGRRPVSAGSITVSVFPRERISLTNHTAFHNTRMEGDNTYREFSNSQALLRSLNFSLLGIRTISNSTDLNVRASRWLGLFTGYRFSSRRIESIQQSDFGFGVESLAAKQTNNLHAGAAGIRLLPARGVRVNIEGEIGRADRPFFPISDRNYHTASGRVQYRAGQISLSAAAKLLYNTNSVSLTAHSAQSRTYSFDAAWTPATWFSVDGGYSKAHLDTTSGLAYFADSTLIEGTSSIYISNIHSTNAGLRLGIGRRADFYAGYVRVQDTGDGRAGLLQPAPAAQALQQTGPAFDTFYPAQTFPLTYHSPMARISFRIHSKLRWNAGYQFYHYEERFQFRQNYRAHTGYTSLLWSF